MFADVVEEPHGVVLDHDVVGRQSLLHLVDPPLHYVPTPLPAEMLRAEKRERGEERDKGRRGRKTRQEEMMGRDRSVKVSSRVLHSRQEIHTSTIENDADVLNGSPVQKTTSLAFLL